MHGLTITITNKVHTYKHSNRLRQDLKVAEYWQEKKSFESVRDNDIH